MHNWFRSLYNILNFENLSKLSFICEFLLDYRFCWVYKHEWTIFPFTRNLHHHCWMQWERTWWSTPCPHGKTASCWFGCKFKTSCSLSYNGYVLKCFNRQLLESIVLYTSQDQINELMMISIVLVDGLITLHYYSHCKSAMRLTSNVSNMRDHIWARLQTLRKELKIWCATEY